MDVLLLSLLFFSASHSVSDVFIVQDDDDTGAVINNFRFTIMGSSCRMNSVAIGFITRSFQELIQLLSSGTAVVGD